MCNGTRWDGLVAQYTCIYICLEYIMDIQSHDQYECFVYIFPSGLWGHIILSAKFHVLVHSEIY